MNSIFEDPDIRWEPAYKITERMTQQIAREFKSSRPRPRNRAMGFRGEKKVRKTDVLGFDET